LSSKIFYAIGLHRRILPFFETLPFVKTAKEKLQEQNVVKFWCCSGFILGMPDNYNRL